MKLQKTFSAERRPYRRRSNSNDFWIHRATAEYGRWRSKQIDEIFSLWTQWRSTRKPSVNVLMKASGTGQFMSEATMDRRADKAAYPRCRLQPPHPVSTPPVQQPADLFWRKNFLSGTKVGSKGTCVARKCAKWSLVTLWPWWHTSCYVHEISCHCCSAGVISNNNDVMPTFFFAEELRVNVRA